MCLNIDNVMQNEGDLTGMKFWMDAGVVLAFLI
jgi:hypothetical protein